MTVKLILTELLTEKYTGTYISEAVAALGILFIQRFFAEPHQLL
jgi:hypothetical protein